MAFEINKVDVWAGELSDSPRALLKKLELLSQAGANLEFVISRPDKRGKAVVFMAPLKGTAQIRAAAEANLAKAASMCALRVVGPNQSGLGERITRALADEGLNLRGVSAAVIGGRSVTYLRFVNADDAQRARRALRRALR
ncbi:MAG: amino acid-binding protein [Phycisphaerae bacterium]|nr:amino acid-binding protein [Phycisphaerae bacterium]